MSDDPANDPRDDDSDNDAIFADSVDGPNDDRSPLDQLAERAVDTMLELMRRANRLAAGVLMFAGGACIAGFLLGVAALDGGARTVWIVLGGAGALWAIGSVVVAMWRLQLVRGAGPALVDEVRSVIGGDSDSKRTVVETVDVTQESVDDSVVQVSQQFFSFRDVVQQDQTTSHPQLTLALAAITSFPAKMLLAMLIALGFMTVSLIFVLILIF